jgi:tetratricopeptide (TPR) repeat protein
MHKPKAGKRLAAGIFVCLLVLLISGCGDKEAAYDKALAVFAEGDYAQAATAFSRLGDFLQAETYAAYSQGLTYYGQGNFAAAEPYFEQTRGFMYGEQRYSFCHANVLEEAGDFAQAAIWYEALGEYEDAPERLAYCLARIAADNGDYETALVKYAEAGSYSDAPDRLDKLNFEIYERAKAFLDAMDYRQAFLLFTLLGDRYDATEYARTAKNHMLEQDYVNAEQMIKDGDLQGAYDVFHAMAGFRDAAARADELANLLGIDTTAE